jgi:hypothetical protein
MYLLVLTRPEMNESRISAEFIDLVVFRVVNTSIDVYQMSLFSQFTGNLSDIDTHAASVFGS